jgi:hypothetical protein
MDPRTEKFLAEREQKAAAIPPILRGPVRAAGDLKFRLKPHGFVVKAAAVAALVVMCAAYYVFVATPAGRFEASQLAARAAERIKTDTSARQIAMDDCLAKAAAESEARWKAACNARRERAGCALTARVNQDLQRKETEGRNTCLMRFSVAAQ